MRHSALLPRMILALVAFAAFSAPAAALAQGDIYLDLVEPALKSAAVPGNCSAWHELWPAFCGTHHQDEYQDNGDGVVSACDLIKLDGLWYHVEWAGPTFFLTCGSTPNIFEPTDSASGGNPTCQIWNEVYPNHGQQFHVDGWQDNGDGILSACDIVFIAGLTCHIDRIGLNIVVRPVTTPTEHGTWGKIKGLFGKIF